MDLITQARLLDRRLRAAERAQRGGYIQRAADLRRKLHGVRAAMGWWGVVPTRAYRERSLSEFLADWQPAIESECGRAA